MSIDSSALNSIMTQWMHEQRKADIVRKKSDISESLAILQYKMPEFLG